MKAFKYLLVVPLIAALSSTASAVLVTSVTGGTGLGTTFTVNSIVVSTPTENNVASMGGPGAVGPANTISIDIDVLEKHVPFTFDFSVAETGSPTPAMSNVTSYLVSITMTHMVPGSPASAINGFDITAGGAASPLFNGLSLPLSSTFTTNPVPLPGGTFRFGGLNGGGTGQLLYGDSATSTINLDLISIGGPTGPATQTLTLVANPEPATMALAGLALIPAGIAARRRRKKNLEGQTETAEVA